MQFLKDDVKTVNVLIPMLKLQRIFYVYKLINHKLKIVLVGVFFIYLYGQVAAFHVGLFGRVGCAL